MKYFSERMRKEEGFTLIELLIVIIILGILIAIAVPIYLSVRGSAESRTCESTRKAVRGAARAYMFDSDMNAWGATDFVTLQDAGYEDPQDPWDCPDAAGVYTMSEDFTTGAPQVWCDVHHIGP